MKGPARARTSGGVREMSNAWGIAEPPLRVFKKVWCLASMVRIEAAAARTFLSSMRVEPPK
jgi:hypothetical protein